MNCGVCGREARLCAHSLCYSCYMRYLDRDKPLAATRPRRYKRRKDALLDSANVRSAYYLYQCGMSVLDIANLGWEKWGYATPRAAARCIDIAFRREGFRLRSPSKAVKLAKDGPCSGCGCPKDQRTRGCPRCRDRHNKRLHRGTENARTRTLAP